MPGTSEKVEEFLNGHGSERVFSAIAAATLLTLHDARSNRHVDWAQLKQAGAPQDQWSPSSFVDKHYYMAMEAIVSATRSAAELLDQSERLGSIAPGKLADVIAVPGDPLTDTSQFGKVHFVMKNGKVYKQP